MAKKMETMRGKKASSNCSRDPCAASDVDEASDGDDADEGDPADDDEPLPADKDAERGLGIIVLVGICRVRALSLS